MNIIKRVKSVINNKVLLPVYSKTVGLVREEKKVRQKYSIGNKNVAIFGTPNHGNLGDYAIGVAEKELFRKYFSDYNIFDVDLTDFPKEKKALSKVLKRTDILVLTGGGNLGNEYMDDEMVRRDTIRMFPLNKIIMFPQTMYFTPNECGVKEKRKTQDIYNNHKHLLLMARDERSYADMKCLFRGPVISMPDVVLTMNGPVRQDREGALLLLRSDVEKKYTTEQIERIEQVLKTIYKKVDKTDTEISTEEFLGDREGTLNRKLNQIAGACIVVTDRLHGMIFAAITETPCIVLDNYNHKIRETYKWLENLPYIRYITDLNVAEQNIYELKQMSVCHYDAQKINEKYDDLMREIMNG